MDKMQEQENNEVSTIRRLSMLGMFTHEGAMRGQQRCSAMGINTVSLDLVTLCRDTNHAVGTIMDFQTIKFPQFSRLSNLWLAHLVDRQCIKPC
jgi:translation initiation factor IF-3